jgi:hypothetical protein
MHVDEAHYMRRTMLVLHGLGPQEPVSGAYPYPFDHPYFGQLFLAGALKLIDYPHSLNPSLGSANLEDSIQSLYLVPRVVMGLLAVLDTFLIYKISQLRYNRNTALFASVLFAVMPLTWMFRRIYLDTILTPFLLSSALFALYCSTTRFNNDTKKTLLLFSLSGAFLGMAIFTKIPAQYFHWIPVLPIFCIAAARLMEFLSNKIGKTQVLELGGIKSIVDKNKLRMLLPYTIIFVIGIFGFVSTTLLISTNVNASFFDIYAAILQHMPSSSNSRIVDNSITVYMIGSHWWLWNAVWIPSYVFHKNIDLIDPHFDPFFKKPIESKKLLFIVDQSFIHQTLRRNPFILTTNSAGFHIYRLESLYINTAKVATMVDSLGPYDSTKFPYTNIPVMILLENRGLGPVEIRSN